MPIAQSMKTLQHYILNLASLKKDSFLRVLDKNGKVTTHSAYKYFTQIQKLSKALVHSGLQKGQKVAILSNTRYEWSVSDLAITAAGGVVVPIYPNTTTEELTYILNHSECCLIFVENKASLRQQLLVRDQCPHLKNIIVFDPPAQPEPGMWLSFAELIEKEGPPLDFQSLCHQAKPEDPVTIIYTSGTTGLPKGVVLTHHQIIHEIIEAFSGLQITSREHTLSFLPYSHVLGRTEHWGNLIIGYQMTFSSGLERLIEELTIVEPTIVVGVPRVFEKIYTALKAKIETRLIDKKIFEWAFQIGSTVSEKKQKGESLDWRLNSEYLLARKLLLDRLKSELFGSKLKFAISGGAPLSQDIIRFFHCCGILILEGYGLTETTGAICVNRPYDFEFGTVGKPLYQSKIKIAKDGEILVQGPSVLSEYYNDPRFYLAQVENDWLHTGDIGEISAAGNLIIKDRKKDLIKTANGKYVAPQKIENLFKQIPFISHIHLHGDQRSYIVALLTLNKNYVFNKARELGINFKTMADLKEHPSIKEFIRAGVAQINAQLASHETIKNYAVLTEDFNIESGEITPSLKVKRRAIDEKYKSIINSLY